MSEKNFVVKNGIVVNTSFTANASQVGLGTIGSTNGVVVTVNSITIGNSTVNATINSTSFSGAAAGSTANTAAQYTWTNTQTFSNTITFNQTILGTANNSLYLGGTVASGYQTSAGLSANVATLTANNANNLNGVAAASYVNTSGSYTISGVHTHSANVVLQSGLSANGSFGTNGQVLMSNGTTGSPYWSTVSFSINTAAMYTWSNTHTFSGAIFANQRIVVTATTFDGVLSTSNSGVGVSGTSNATHGVIGISNTAYGVYGLSNTSIGVYAQSKSGNPFSAANLTTTFMSVYANGNVGIANSTPVDALSVGGSIYSTSLSTTGSIAVGNSASVNGSVTVNGGIQSANVLLSAKTDAYTLVAADSGTVITVSNTASKSVTVPSGLPVGFRCLVYQVGTGNVVIANASGVTLSSRTGNYTCNTRYGSMSVIIYSTDSVIVDGNIV